MQHGSAWLRNVSNFCHEATNKEGNDGNVDYWWLLFYRFACRFYLVISGVYSACSKHALCLNQWDSSKLEQWGIRRCQRLPHAQQSEFDLSWASPKQWDRKNLCDKVGIVSFQVVAHEHNTTIYNICFLLFSPGAGTISFLFALCTPDRISDNKWKAVVTKLNLDPSVESRTLYVMMVHAWKIHAGFSMFFTAWIWTTWADASLLSLLIWKAQVSTGEIVLWIAPPILHQVLRWSNRGKRVQEQA